MKRAQTVKTQAELKALLQEIDNDGYGAYKQLQGAYQIGHFELHLDYIQGDPFASPSKARIRLPQYKAGFPEDLFENRTRKLALEDYLARKALEAIFDLSKGHRGSGKSGKIYIDSGGQEVLERTACEISKDWVELRIEIGLPARGRKIMSEQQAAEMLCEEIPGIAAATLLWSSLPQEEVYGFVYCIENQEAIRSKLDSLGLIAFVADGSILPRESGASDKPLSSQKAVPFRAPESMRVSFSLPHEIIIGDEPRRELTGLGIPRGITLIVGGGYHGKSTLLQAIERGVYPHIPGDGREYVVSNPNLLKVRAEDGRRVEKVDIHSFISDLPNEQEQDTHSFSSRDASGSTSQAANIVEALEMGVEGLLVDEDTSATNFMIRDARMQALVSTEHEPITPYLDRVMELYDDHGISTVMVMGGSGDYFDVAHNVLMMRNYVPHDVTQEAHTIADKYESNRHEEQAVPFEMPAPRIPVPDSFSKAQRGNRHIKVRPRGKHMIQFGRENIELQGVEQLMDHSQTFAIGESMQYAVEHLMNGERTLREVMDRLDELFDEEGIAVLSPYGNGQHPGNYARPRRFEIAAAINRLRVVQMRRGEPESTE